MQSEKIMTVGPIAYMRLFGAYDRTVSVADIDGAKDYRKLFWRFYLAQQ